MGPPRLARTLLAVSSCSGSRAEGRWRALHHLKKIFQGKTRGFFAWWRIIYLPSMQIKDFSTCQQKKEVSCQTLRDTGRQIVTHQRRLNLAHLLAWQTLTKNWQRLTVTYRYITLNSYCTSLKISNDLKQKWPTIHWPHFLAQYIKLLHNGDILFFQFVVFQFVIFRVLVSQSVITLWQSTNWPFLILSFCTP